MINNSFVLVLNFLNMMFILVPEGSTEVYRSQVSRLLNFKWSSHKLCMMDMHAPKCDKKRDIKCSKILIKILIGDSN